MRRWFGTTLILLALLAATSSARADDKPTIDARQYPGAPIVFTGFTSFFESAGFKGQHIVCVSFRAATRALTGVTFAVASRDAQGTEYQRLTIERSGTFTPGTDVVGDPRYERRNCREMNIMRTDAPFVSVRLVAATYEDGTGWSAPSGDLPPRPTAPPATPSPVTGSAPPWNAASHAHYLAVAYGRGPAHVAIFAPGQTVPSAVLDLPACCAAAVAFDASGSLYVATTGNGIAVFAPGATAPSRRLPAGGTALAIDAAGNVAAGGAERDRSVHVYPAGGEAGAYTLPGRVAAGGLAFAPTGELAVADGSATVSFYAPGAAAPSRTQAATPETNLVRFDAAGHLAVASTSFDVVTMLAPTASVSKVEVKGLRPRALAFDAAGRLLVGIPNGIQPVTAGSPPATRLLGPAADVLAADPNGAFAAGNAERGTVILYASDTRTVLGGLDGVRGLAFSP